MKAAIGFIAFFVAVAILLPQCGIQVHKGCDLALASYLVPPSQTTLSNITSLMQSEVLYNSDDTRSYNKGKVLATGESLQSFTRINIPFPCDCINGELLGHVFRYSITANDT